MGGVPLKENSMWEKCKQLYEPCAEYGWPARTCEAEMISYKLQCDRHVLPEDRKQPTVKELEQANKILLPQYIKHTLPEALTSWERVDLMFDLIEEMMSYVKRDASPGSPYAYVASTNGSLLDQYSDLILDVVHERLMERLMYSTEQLEKMTPEELVDAGLMDPVRIFVKSEPHKKKKLVEGRVRLIHSVSIVDKLIEMVLIRHLTKLEISNWYKIPSKPGIGFTESDNSVVYDDVIHSLPMSGSDVEGWDWNVDKWQILDDAEMCIKLCNNPSVEWERSIRACAILESKSVYQFSNGVLVKNIFEGIVNSGKYKTSSGNSRMRTKLATLIGANKCIAAGDDAVERTVERAREKYAEYGFKIKAYDNVEDQFEFCSRIYTGKGSWPLNAGKMMMNLVHNIPKNDFEFRMYMTGFENDLGTHPEFPFIMQVIRDVGYFELGGAQEEVDG